MAAKLHNALALCEVDADAGSHGGWFGEARDVSGRVRSGPTSRFRSLVTGRNRGPSLIRANVSEFARPAIGQVASEEPRPMATGVSRFCPAASRPCPV
jgi:hypothetical protein